MAFETGESALQLVPLIAATPSVASDVPPIDIRNENMALETGESALQLVPLIAAAPTLKIKSAYIYENFRTFHATHSSFSPTKHIRACNAYILVNDINENICS